MTDLSQLAAIYGVSVRDDALRLLHVGRFSGERSGSNVTVAGDFSAGGCYSSWIPKLAFL